MVDTLQYITCPLCKAGCTWGCPCPCCGQEGYITRQHAIEWFAKEGVLSELYASPQWLVPDGEVSAV